MVGMVRMAGSETNQTDQTDHASLGVVSWMVGPFVCPMYIGQTDQPTMPTTTPCKRTNHSSLKRTNHAWLAGRGRFGWVWPELANDPLWAPESRFA
jgi:hypothetical protein